jgi:hypothetical protein
MRVWRRARVDARVDPGAQTEAQAAMAVADAHAQAGLRAQIDEMQAPGAAPRPGTHQAREEPNSAGQTVAGGWPPSGVPQYYVPWSPPGVETSPLDPDVSQQPAPAVAPPAAAIAPVPAPAPAPPGGGIEMQTEFLRVLEVVTRMCDHVIEYIEADRAERKIMVETLGQLARVIATNTNAVESAAMRHVPVPTVGVEHVIGGSMERGPDPVVDLREPEATADIRVEVRCSFGEGERWVDGFEIIDVTDSDDGPMYRLRRQRDGAILPQLFEAASIRHVETFQELSTERTTWTKL